MTHPNPHLAYRPDIDGLRAIAVLAVVVFHAFPALLPGGFVGVDVFFVISGFLISSIIFKALHAGEFSFADFYARRVRRIFPALLLVIVGSLVLGWSILLPDEYAQLGKHAIAGLGFVANFVFWQEAGYFDTEAELKPLLHLWSLGIEEQFYIVWPALAVLAWRWRARFRLVLVGLLAASFGASVLLTANDPVAGYFLPHTRAWELLIGAALAYWTYRRGRLPGGDSATRASVLALIGLGLIGLGLALIDKSSVFPGWLALLPSGGAALLIAAGPRSRVNRIVLANPVMVWIGLISFPLYLWHWPLLSFLRIVSPNPGDGLLAGAVAGAILLAWLTYRICETPVRIHGGSRAVVGLACASLVAASVGANIFIRDGLGFRLKDAQARKEAKALEWDDALRASPECRSVLPPNVQSNCLITDKAVAPTAAIIGDSHANHYYWGLSRALHDDGGSLLYLGRVGCLPLYGLDVRKEGRLDDCPGSINTALDYVSASPTIDTVFIAGRWMTRMTGKELKDRLADIPQDEELVFAGVETADPAMREQLVVQALDATLTRLEAAGKRVVFMHAVPELSFDARECVAWSPNQFVQRIPRPDCALKRALADARNAEFRPALDQVLKRHPRVMIFDPVPLMCDEHNCFGKRDGVLVYRDDDHLSLDGSYWMGEQVRRQLPRVMATSSAASTGQNGVP